MDLYFTTRLRMAKITRYESCPVLVSLGRAIDVHIWYEVATGLPWQVAMEDAQALVDSGSIMPDTKVPHFPFSSLWPF